MILPASCYSPDGTDCVWYRQCLAKMFPCTGRADYAISYGEKFCKAYEQSKSKFSQKALQWIVEYSPDVLTEIAGEYMSARKQESVGNLQWIDAVRKCLQVALVPLLHLCQVQPTCEDIKTKAFGSHVPCYLEPYGGFSVCHLSATDWIAVFATIQDSFTSDLVETVKASVVTAGKCGGVLADDLAGYLYSIGVWVWDSTGKYFRRDRRAAGDTLADDEMAYAVVHDISSVLSWEQDSTVDTEEDILWLDHPL